MAFLKKGDAKWWEAEPYPSGSRRMSAGNVQAKRNKAAFFRRNTGTLMWSEKLGKMVLRDE